MQQTKFPPHDHRKATITRLEAAIEDATLEEISKVVKESISILLRWSD
jgi:hypothetical protein